MARWWCPWPCIHACSLLEEVGPLLLLDATSSPEFEKERKKNLGTPEGSTNIYYFILNLRIIIFIYMLKYHWWLKFDFIISFIAYFLWTSKMIILFYKSNLKLDLMRIGYIDRNLSPLKAHLTLLCVRQKYFGPIGGLPNFFQDKYLGPSVHMGHRWINLIKVVPLG